MKHCVDGDLSECGPGKGCCNEVCCEQKYFSQFAELPCVTDNGCQV